MGIIRYQIKVIKLKSILKKATQPSIYIIYNNNNNNNNNNMVERFISAQIF